MRNKFSKNTPMIITDIFKPCRKKKTGKNLQWRVLKNAAALILTSFLIISNTPILSAYEAHIVNVTAQICDYSETRSCGYWKNHSGVYNPHLPQTLGGYPTDEIIDTAAKANNILTAACGTCGCGCDKTMRGKLKGQLLTMKFNLAHFGIGEYLVEDEGKTLNQIAVEADNLLRQNPPPPNSVLEEMKNLLDNLNNLEQIKYCSTSDTSDSEEYVVINEFLPNPIGNDDAPMPNGEWVELYNKGKDIDIAGWMLYDINDSHKLQITSGNTNTGGTLILSGGFLVVYRNGDSDFALNNTGGDSVRLYNGEIGGGGTLIDSYAYTINALEGKSFARIPDGSDNWVDPIPTPGGPNVSEDKEIVFGPALSEPDEKEINYTQKNSENKAKKPNTESVSVIKQDESETPQVDNNTNIQTDDGPTNEEITQPNTGNTESNNTENPPLEQNNNADNNQNTQIENTQINLSPLYFEEEMEEYNEK